MQHVRVCQCRTVFFYRIAEIKIVIEVAFRNRHPDAFCTEPVVGYPMKQLCAISLDFRNLLFLPFYPNGEASCVAECIGERIREMVRLLFFDANDCPIDALLKRSRLPGSTKLRI